MITIGNAPYFLSLTEGILTFISPCILPLLPVYISYLAGISEDEQGGGEVHRARLIANAVGFVAGFTIIFVLLGATATSIGSFLKQHKDIFRMASGIIMIIFGLNFTGILKIAFLNREKRIDYKFKQLRFHTSIIFGAVFAFGWTPCVGAFLYSAVLMAGSSETVWQGMLLLLVYSLGLGIPFIITSVLLEKLKNALRFIQKHNRIISIVSGIVLILAGILVFADKLKYLGPGLV